MKQQDLDPARSDTLCPDLVLSADHWNHANAGDTNIGWRIDRCNCSELRIIWQRSCRHFGLQRRGQDPICAERDRSTTLKELSPIHKSKYKSVRRQIVMRIRHTTHRIQSWDEPWN